MFFLGFFVGILVSAAAAVGLAGYLIRHPQTVMVKAADVAVKHVVEKAVESVPRDYIGQRQDDIAASAHRFSQAFSQNRVTSAEMNTLARQMVAVIADQQITETEIDNLLRLMDSYAR